ncbi:MAG TPA: phosphatase [Actinomycetota bacterium]|nr:phosphatase [Actinomycetota bacterium]
MHNEAGLEHLETIDRSNRWRRAEYSTEELARALLDGRIAGEVTSHDRHNVRWKIKRLVRGDPDLQFGLTGLDARSPDEVLSLVAAEAGFDPDPFLRDDPVPIDPLNVLAACREVGARLATAAERGEQVVLATGHPAGLLLLYLAVGELLAEAGAKLLRPGEGLSWRELDHHREIRYFHGVAALTDRASALHTHRADPMERMLEETRPDLVFADHGFAGAAIDAGIDTVSIADINDPALVVAKAEHRTEAVIVMDDNVRPDDYWPCFQAIASQFP